MPLHCKFIAKTDYVYVFKCQSENFVFHNLVLLSAGHEGIGYIMRWYFYSPVAGVQKVGTGVAKGVEKVVVRWAGGDKNKRDN